MRGIDDSKQYNNLLTIVFTKTKQSFQFNYVKDQKISTTVISSRKGTDIFLL